jgi:hypothetical protein
VRYGAANVRLGCGVAVRLSERVVGTEDFGGRRALAVVTSEHIGRQPGQITVPNF